MSTIANTDVTNVNDTPPSKPKRRFSWGKLGIFICVIAIIIFFGAFGFGYFQLAKVNIMLANQVTDLAEQITTNQTTLSTLRNDITTLQQAGQQSQALSAKQAQMIAEWQAAQQGDLHKWYAAEAQYLVRLANDHVQFTHDVPMAITLLQRAGHVLENVHNPNQALLDIRQAIANNIVQLQAAPQVDITALYLQLNALNQQLDELPLPATPLSAANAAASTDTMTSTTNEMPVSWWQQGLTTTWQTLQKIVIVRYNGTQQLPLVLPEEKMFLYQNLHAQMEGAMWAVLQHNTAIYQASLARAIVWITHYFDPAAAVSTTLLQQLQTLEKTNLQPATANLADTLQLFDQYFAGEK